MSARTMENQRREHGITTPIPPRPSAPGGQNPTTPTDRSTEPQAEPCATHEVRLRIFVTARVCEGTEARHLFEHCQALLQGRTPDLHEDILDELRMADLDVRGQEVPA